MYSYIYIGLATQGKINYYWPFKPKK